MPTVESAEPALPNVMPDRDPDTVATPEGDNEFAPGEPLTEVPAGQQIPAGGAPLPYDADRPPAEKHHPTGLEWVIDEISHGTLLP